jgi:2,3-bisphosphoglycerate-dependent phosphoglycerate mutase
MTMSSIIAKVYIVRHGETNENRQRIIQGQLDTLLNEQGILQAKTLATALNSTPFDVAMTSNLQRASKVCLHPYIISTQPLDETLPFRQRKKF